MNKPFSQSNDPGTVPSSECRESELDALATVPTMFAPGDDKLSQQEFGAHSRPAPLGPQGGSMAGLPDSLIMMVDDEILNIEMTQAFLLEAGYRHFASTDAPELAVDAMRAQPPGVLLLVSTITGTWRRTGSAPMASRMSRPLTLGMLRSSSSTPGGCARMASTASSGASVLAKWR